MKTNFYLSIAALVIIAAIYDRNRKNASSNEKIIFLGFIGFVGYNIIKKDLHDNLFG
jgi:hypothetical protein